ncbi:MAG: hypothetical protein FWF85_10095 [Clostridiales bacterium]|nr:hypothetical protein [Clostridiales bacterium]
MQDKQVIKRLEKVLSFRLVKGSAEKRQRRENCYVTDGYSVVEVRLSSSRVAINFEKVIAVLRDLNQLTSLVIYCCHISDITPLVELRKLTRLCLVA